MSEFKTATKWVNKYRPRHFDELIGQPDAVALMKGIIKTKEVPAAFMFHGPWGCGKTTSARMLARYLNCAKGTACGKCPSCLEPEDSHPDVIELNGATQRTIDEVRKLIEKARFLPRYNFRVFILDEIHQWTPQSAEAFLKPLEDPPPRTVYMLCTSEPQKMKGTTVSRCTQVAIQLPTRKEIVKRLKTISEKRKTGFKDKILEACAESSGGHVRDAVSLLESAYLKKMGDDSIKTDDLVKSIMRSGALESSKVAVKILLGMYLQKDKIVAKAVFDVTEAIPTMNAALRMNEYVLAMDLFDKQPPNSVWHSPENREFSAQFTKHVKDYKISDMLRVEKKLVDARVKMQDFAVPEKSLLLSLLT